MAKLTDASPIGGIDYDGQCGCTIDFYYASSADRNAAQAKFEAFAELAKQHNVMSFGTIDRGDCGVRMIFVAASTADWKAVNDIGAADADFGAIVIGKCLIDCPSNRFRRVHRRILHGTLRVGGGLATAQKGWTKATKAVSSVQCSRSDNSMIGHQLLTFENEAAWTDAAIRSELLSTSHVSDGTILWILGPTLFKRPCPHDQQLSWRVANTLKDQSIY